MRKEVVYVSGPMLNHPNHNKGYFNRVTKLLRKVGYTVINPVELDTIYKFRKKKPEWSDFIIRDIKIILNKKVSMIVLLEDWGKSKGSKAEIYIGKEVLNAKIKEFKEYDNKWELIDVDIKTEVSVNG